MPHFGAPFARVTGHVDEAYHLTPPVSREGVAGLANRDM